VVAPLASLAAAAATATANAAYLRYSPHMSKLCTCQLDQPVWIRCSNTLAYRVYQDLRDICNSKRLQQSPENLKGISIFHIILSISLPFPFHSQVEFILYAGQHLHHSPIRLRRKCSHYKRGPINMGMIMIMMIGTWDVDLASMIVIQLLWSSWVNFLIFMWVGCDNAIYVTVCRRPYMAGRLSAKWSCKLAAYGLYLQNVSSNLVQQFYEKVISSYWTKHVNNFIRKL